MAFSGIMRGDDGGNYYATTNTGIGENGQCAWFGVADDGNSWGHVFWGRTFADGQIIEGMQGQIAHVPWADGDALGTIKLRFGTIWSREAVSIGFGASRWSELSTPPPFPELSRGVRRTGSGGLQGVWLTDTGAQYYVREADDNNLFWFAIRPDFAASHVAKGIRRDQTNLSMQWLDIPPGRTRSGGFLELEIVGDGLMLKRTASASFGSTRWVRLS